MEKDFLEFQNQGRSSDGRSSDSIWVNSNFLNFRRKLWPVLRGDIWVVRNCSGRWPFCHRSELPLFDQYPCLYWFYRDDNNYLHFASRAIKPPSCVASEAT